MADDEKSHGPTKQLLLGCRPARSIDLQDFFNNYANT